MSCISSTSYVTWGYALISGHVRLQWETEQVLLRGGDVWIPQAGKHCPDGNKHPQEKTQWPPNTTKPRVARRKPRILGQKPAAIHQNLYEKATRFGKIRSCICICLHVQNSHINLDVCKNRSLKDEVPPLFQQRQWFLKSLNSRGLFQGYLSVIFFKLPIIVTEKSHTY